MREVDLLVVGAGPAGLGAAAEGTAVGLRTLVVDAAPVAGGQYYAHPTGRDWKDGLPPGLWAGADERLLELRTSTGAWGAFGDAVALESDNQPEVVRPAATVLATGAIERPLPFPGWDRPDVVAPGALQRLLKVSKVVPSGRVVLAGSGPFLLAVASQLRAAGAELVAVVERRTRRDLAPLVPALARSTERWHETTQFARALRGVELRFGLGVVAVDEDGLLLSDGSRIVADTYGIGHGFVPRLELARLMGVRAEESRAITDEWLATTRDGVFAAGELAGIGGSLLAAAEGRIAGLGAARYLGVRIDAARVERLRKERRRHLRFATVLARAYPDEPLLARATPETIICRCESVRLRDLRTVADERGPLDDPRAAKAELRCGMGPCQGAICAAAIRTLVGYPGGLDDRRLPRARPPVVPITVGAVARADTVDR